MFSKSFRLLLPYNIVQREAVVSGNNVDKNSLVLPRAYFIEAVDKDCFNNMWNDNIFKKLYQSIFADNLDDLIDMSCNDCIIGDLDCSLACENFTKDNYPPSPVDENSYCYPKHTKYPCCYFYRKTPKSMNIFYRYSEEQGLGYDIVVRPLPVLNEENTSDTTCIVLESIIRYIIFISKDDIDLNGKILLSTGILFYRNRDSSGVIFNSIEEVENAFKSEDGINKIENSKMFLTIYPFNKVEKNNTFGFSITLEIKF